MKFVEDVIDRMQITFVKNDQSKWLIDVKTKRTFEAALNGINHESISSNIFASIEYPEIDSPHPLQVKFEHDRCATFLTLKGCVTEMSGDFMF